jgi:pilus assembly protein CpaE
MTKKNVVLLLITNKCDMETLSLAMDCGIAKVFTTEKSTLDIQEGIIAEIDRANTRYAEAEEKVYNSKIVSVFGTKGGTGKTTIAVNFAVALQKAGKKVLLIDLDLQFGDVGVFLNVPRFDTISDLVQEGDFNAVTINSYLYTHTSGVKVLCAPQSPEFAEIVKPEHITRIAESLRNSLDYIIFDLGPMLDECVLQALEISDSVYFITTPEISTLKNTKTCMNVMETLGIADKMKFILNKNGDSYVKQKDMEATLNAEIVLVIPNETKNAITAINRGVPIITAAPKSKIAKSICKFIGNGEI